ncbi:MAG: arylsulfatase A-like enzyme [Rhodothermales bacterium]|jgi:arylsulfatase A-like enzyme
MKRSLFACLVLCAVTALSETPNFVVIMADDVGYGDLSCYGATRVQTPNLDRLAAEGIRFTSGYCSASTCTPTRYSMLTGDYAFRRKGTGIAPPASPAIIQPDRHTIAKQMKKAGYATAVVGKWHLGLGAPGVGPQWNGELRPGPGEIGFDYHFLLPTTNDRVPQVYVENGKVLNLDPDDPITLHKKSPSPEHPNGIDQRAQLKMDWTHGHNQTIHNGISRIGFYTGGKEARFRDEDLADAWVAKSLKWIGDNKEKPFFLFFASHDNHVPRMPHERFQGKSKLGLRGDAIVELDWCVGELVKGIDSMGLGENTLIVFCSDNGPVMDDGYADGALEQVGDHRAAGPYTGGKYSIYEGGTRTPFITRWTSKIKPGQTSDLMVCTIDLATSFSNYVKAELPENGLLDSLDVMGAMLGQPGAKGRVDLVQQSNRGVEWNKRVTMSYRKGDWKLLRHDGKQARNLVVEKHLENTKVPQYQLINLAKDPGEKTNVINEHPAKAAELKAGLESIIAAGRTR